MALPWMGGHINFAFMRDFSLFLLSRELEL
nr:MAG TPA: hypothetical protein [Caudoviricetes sp.]